MKTSKCLNCNAEFKYYEIQQGGKFCSNKCQGEYSIKSRLIEGTTMNSTMRKYLNKILGNCCKECSQGREWNGKQLVLQIDHMNGNKKDNRIINLRLLCPNCHSQTGNWGIKNISDKGKNNLSTNKKADARQLTGRHGQG